MKVKEFIETVKAEKIILDGETYVKMMIPQKSTENGDELEFLKEYCKTHKEEIIAELDRQEAFAEDKKELEYSVAEYYRLLKNNSARKADELFSTMSERQKAFIVAKEYVQSSAYNMNRYGSEALNEIVRLKDGTSEQYLAIIETLEKNYEDSLVHIRSRIEKEGK